MAIALFVGFLVVAPGVLLSLDAAIPYEKKQIYDQDLKYMGASGSSFNSQYWNAGLEWLAEQDSNMSNYEKPAWISWWDYGFWAINVGRHPTVADNFQNGYQLAGSFIASQNESEAVSLLVARLLEGNVARNSRYNGMAGFTPEVRDLLIKHLDGGNTQYHPHYDKILDIYLNPGKYQEIVMDNQVTYGHYIDVTDANAKYAVVRVELQYLGKENIVNLLHDVEAETKTSIQYFGVDSRLFPFNARNTGIFYAPIKLADKDINDYLEYMAYCQRNIGDSKKPIWQDYPNNPLTSDQVKTESETLKRDFRIVDYTLKYTDQFYNSMFYKCYIGYNYKDIGFQQEDQGVPSMFGQIASYPALQGWNMTHFKVVYRTMYYSEKDEANASFPEDYTAMNYDEALVKVQTGKGDVKSGLGQGVFILKYYDGAMLNGTLRLENGTPIAKARITVQDEYGIPHGVFITDENGKYSVILPPGESRIIVGKNELREGDSYVLDRIYQFQMDLTNYRPVDPYNVSLFQITDEQSMRKTSDWLINQDITVIPSSTRGKIYYDNNANGQFDSDVDQYVNNAYLRLEQTNGNLMYKNGANYNGQSSGLYYDRSLESAVKANEPITNGELFFNDLIPGTYQPILYIDGHKIDVADTYTILPGDNLAGKDIPVKVSNITGIVYNPDGSNNTGVMVELKDDTSNTTTNVTTQNGQYSFEELLPGSYTISIDQAGYYSGSRIVQLGSGESNNSVFQLIPTAVVKGKVSVMGQMASGQGLKNIYVEFNNVKDQTLSMQTTTDNSGSYTINLPKGVYAIYANYISGQSAYASLGTVTVDSLNTVYIRDLAFKNAVLVYGNITKLVDSPASYAAVILTSKSGAQVMTLTNNSGNYRAYVPYDTYEIYIYHVSEPGNNTFSNQTTIDLTDTGISKKRVDFKVEFSLPVSGTLYWDMDDNSRYTSASEISLPFGTRLDGGLGTILDGTSSSDSTSTLEEGQTGVELIFESTHYTLKAMTDSKGGFSLALPPDEYKVYTKDARYESVSYSLDIPSGPTNDVFTNQSYSIVPKLIDLELDYYSDVNGNGKMELGEGARDVPMTFTPAVAELGMVSTKTDYNGNIKLQLYPVSYRMKVNYTTVEMGTSVEYGLDNILGLSVGQTTTPLEFAIGKKIGLSGNVEYADNFGVPVPASNVTVELIPAKQVSGNTGKYYSSTNLSGGFDISVYEGDYTIYVTATLGGKDYVYQKRFLATTGASLGKMRLELSVNETGLVTDQDSTTIDGLPISITDIATNATINVTTKDGRYSVHLLPDTMYRFFVDHHVVVDDKDIWHRFDSTIVASQMNKTFDLKVLKLLSVAFQAYYDENFDSAKQATEVKGGILIGLDTTDQKVPDQYKHLSMTCNAIVGVKIYLPYGRYTATVVSDVYAEAVTTSTPLDINYNMKTSVDVKIIAKDVAVTGMTMTNLSGVMSKVPSTIIRFMPKTGTQIAREVTVASGANSKYSTQLYPVEYDVYAYHSGYAGAVYAYLGTTTISIGKPATLDLVLSIGDDVSGAVFFYNTTNSLVMKINKERGLKFTYNGGTLYVNIKDGAYQAYLPKGFVQVTGDYQTKEYGKAMTYTVSTALNVTPGKTDLSAYSLRFVKTEDHSLALAFLFEDDFSVTVKANETKHYQLRLTNLGNSVSDVTFSTNNVPSGWRVDIPSTAKSVGIGQERIVLVNVTTSQTPLALNLIDIVAKSKQGSESATLKLGINTPKLFRFNMNIVGDHDNGVYLSSTSEYNISIKNDGNAGDKVLLMFKRTPATKWNVTIQGEPVDYDGYNLSISEFEYRNLSLKVRAPNGTLAKTGDKFTLEVTATSLFYPELEPQKQTLLLQIRRPNLYFKDITFENTNLKKDKYEFDVNVTVGSDGIETAPTNDKPLLKVFYKDKLLTSQTVGLVPEDGVAYLNFKVNASSQDMVNETVKLKFVLDDNNTIPETNENDNEIMKTFVVGKKSKSEFPYLVVTFGVVIVALVALGFVWWRRRAVYM